MTQVRLNSFDIGRKGIPSFFFLLEGHQEPCYSVGSLNPCKRPEGFKLVTSVPTHRAFLLKFDKIVRLKC